MKLHGFESFDMNKDNDGPVVRMFRVAVPGGWIYRHPATGENGEQSAPNATETFVPDPTCEHWQFQNRIPLKEGWRWDPSEEERHVWILVDPDDAVAGEARPSGQWLHDGHYHTGGFSLMPAMWALARHLDAVAE